MAKIFYNVCRITEQPFTKLHTLVGVNLLQPLKLYLTIPSSSQPCENKKIEMIKNDLKIISISSKKKTLLQPSSAIHSFLEFVNDRSIENIIMLILD